LLNAWAALFLSIVEQICFVKLINFIAVLKPMSCLVGSCVRWVYHIAVFDLHFSCGYSTIQEQNKSNMQRQWTPYVHCTYNAKLHKSKIWFTGECYLTQCALPALHSHENPFLLCEHRPFTQGLGVQYSRNWQREPRYFGAHWQLYLKIQKSLFVIQHELYIDNVDFLPQCQLVFGSDCCTLISEHWFSECWQHPIRMKISSFVSFWISFCFHTEAFQTLHSL